MTNTTSQPKEEYAGIRCCDSRYCELHEEMPKGYYLTAAGSSLRFVQSHLFRQEFFDQVNLLRQAGKNIVGIIIADHFCSDGHHGCAAYGEDDSYERHVANLSQAAALIHEHIGFEDMEIKMLLHDIDKEELITIPQPQKVTA